MRNGPLLSVAHLLLMASAALAQSSADRYQRQLEQLRQQQRLKVRQAVPAGNRALIDYGGFLSFNYFSIDDNLDETHVLRQSDLTLYARVNLDDVHEFFVRGRGSILDFNQGDSFDGDGDKEEADLERAYYRFDFEKHSAAKTGERTDESLALTVGRQFVYWANGLVMSNTLDGASIGARYGWLEAELLAGVTEPDTIDFDTSRPGFDDRTRRGFYGALLGVSLQRHRPYAYFLAQEDYNRDETLIRPIGTGDPPPRTSTRFEYDSQYFGLGSLGAFGDRIAYGVELVYESGSGLSNSFTGAGADVTPVAQRKEDIEAFAADIRVDYLFNDPRNTRISSELILASGDDDRGLTHTTFGGNRPGTRDEAFNTLGFVNTGLAFGPTVSNLMAFRIGGSTFPLASFSSVSRLQIGADAFIFARMDRDAPIDEELDNDRRYLGWEPDVFLNWQITEDLSLALRYGIFFPSDTFFEDDNRHSFLVGLTYAF